ncbi:MAG: hypothetical protein KGL39_21620 [Patescibacteria group bacterium]|nr:hypothetical protein [Patescibacteria group bacterium]
MKITLPSRRQSQSASPTAAGFWATAADFWSQRLVSGQATLDNVPEASRTAALCEIAVRQDGDAIVSVPSVFRPLIEHAVRITDEASAMEVLTELRDSGQEDLMREIAQLCEITLQENEGNEELEHSSPRA